MADIQSSSSSLEIDYPSACRAAGLPLQLRPKSLMCWLSPATAAGWSARRS